MKEWLVLVGFLLGFFLAQLWKAVALLIDNLVHHRKVSAGQLLVALTKSGGMPSGHTASMVAVTTLIGLLNGFDTGIFALAVAVTGLVMYDATHVRYAVGEQGKALNKLLKKSGAPEVDLVEGHTLWQVVVGAVLGVVIGWGIWMLGEWLVYIKYVSG